MKKTLKIIVKAIFTIIFIVIAIYVLYEHIILPRLPRVGGIIVAKDNKTITLKSSVDSTERSCILEIEKSPITKEVGGRKIDISDLNIGDKISVVYCKNKGEIIGGESFPPTLNNIKLIQVVESNKDNHMSNDDLSYNNFIITKFQFENDCITLGIDIVNEYFDDYLSGNCRVIQKNEAINNGNIENITIEPSQISFRKLSKHEIEININTYDLTNELERGKYIFIFENEELGVIKIPFEKSYNGIFSDY